MLRLKICDIHGDNCIPLPGVSPVTGKRMIVQNLPTQ